MSLLQSKYFINKMILRLFTTFTILIIVNASVAFGTETSPIVTEWDTIPMIERQSQTLVISIQGKISKNLLSTIAKGIQKLPLEDKFPPSLVVLLDSNGGDGDAAIEIGKLLRKYNAHVFVTNRCGSACVFVYAGGVLRASLPSSIGIHHPRVTMSDSSARVIKELDPSKNESAKNMLSSFDIRANEYFNSMGIDPGFYARVQAQKTSELYWLDEKEILKYKINGGTDEYLDKLTRNISANTHHSLDRDAIILNNLNTLKECVFWKNEPSNFIKCYINNISKE